MEKDNQKILIETLCDQTKEFMLSKLDKIPDNWDGFELRHWFDTITRNENRWSNLKKNEPFYHRMKDCNNEMIVKNLY